MPTRYPTTTRARRASTIRTTMPMPTSAKRVTRPRAQPRTGPNIGGPGPGASRPGPSPGDDPAAWHDAGPGQKRHERGDHRGPSAQERSGGREAEPEQERLLAALGDHERRLVAPLADQDRFLGSFLRRSGHFAHQVVLHGAHGVAPFLGVDPAVAVGVERLHLGGVVLE